MLKQLDRILSKVEDLCGVLAAVGLGAIMLIVASDVGLRYIVGRPWSWAYDVVSIYLTVSIFYLALSRTLREHGHISVDIAHSHMGVRFKHTSDLLICILSAIFFAMIAAITTGLTWTQFSGSDVISSVVDWPTWLSTIFVPIGTVLIIIRLSLLAVTHVAAIRSGIENLPATPLHGADHSISTGE